MPSPRPRLRFALALLVIPGIVSAAEYVVAPDGTDGNAGTKASPWSIGRANEALNPGDTAVLLDGVYTGLPIAPARSGEEGKPITYRAANPLGARFQKMDGLPDSNGPTAVCVSGRSHVVIEGIRVDDVKRWVVGRRSSHITIRDCRFEKGSGWINCRFDESGDGIRLTGNRFHEGTDLASIDGGDGHLVEGNFFGDATHTGLVLLGVQRSVVRGNTFTNRRWRCMEVESRRQAPPRRSLHNRIERNVFDYTPCSAIQYAGSRSILRRNIFRRCLTGMNWASYVGSNKPPKKRSPEAWHNEQNRFYNNVIAECGSHEVVLKRIRENETKGIPVAERVSKTGFGMSFATNLFNPKMEEVDDCAYGDNVVVNTLFYRNANTAGEPDRKGPTSAPTAQIAFQWNATPEFGRFRHNGFGGGKPGSAVFYFADAPYAKPPEPRNRSVAEFQKRYPEWAAGNREIAPGFVDPDGGDYRLRPESPCIDAGGALTETAAAGSGTAVKVRDALYFSDGFGIVEPDVIRIGGSRARVVGVDYEAHILTIDERLTWKAGASVTTDYQGEGPDLGAFEMR